MCLRRRVVARIVAVVLLVAAIYCFMWISSSASLACTACNCEYSLSAPKFRCRQPIIAEILTGVFLATSVVIFVKTRSNPVPMSATSGRQGAFFFHDLMYGDTRPGINVRATLTLLADVKGHRRSDTQVHWRPNHNFGPPDGRAFYIGQVELGGSIEPGETRDVLVRFLDGPGLRENLLPGRSWRIQEGPTLVGSATVVEVLAG